MLCCVALSESLEFSIQTLHQKEYQKYGLQIYTNFSGLVGGTAEVSDDLYFCLDKSRWLTYSGFRRILVCKQRTRTCDRIEMS
jgi:hypothetical protein